MRTLLESADRLVKVNVLVATLSCRISLRSSNAFINCMSFSQALTAALKGDSVRRDRVMTYFAQELERSLPLHALQASADRCAKGDRSGANLSCHIQRKSSNACCHCKPVSQALMAALKVIGPVRPCPGETEAWRNATAGDLQ